MHGVTKRFGLASSELRPLILSFLSFTLLLACYYILRPVRDGLAASLGAGTIKYLSTAVFFVMLGIVPIFGWLVAHVPRPRLVPGVYVFFALNLAVFAMAFGRYADSAAGANWSRAFYVWVTVFNLFAVSVFWSRMADLWSEPQGRSFFGVISAGGSLGGVIGPLLARTLSANIAISGLIWVSALMLGGSLVCLSVLSRYTAVGSPIATTGDDRTRRRLDVRGPVADLAYAFFIRDSRVGLLGLVARHDCLYRDGASGWIRVSQCRGAQ